MHNRDYKEMERQNERMNSLKDRYPACLNGIMDMFSDIARDYAWDYLEEHGDWPDADTAAEDLGTTRAMVIGAWHDKNFTQNWPVYVEMDKTWQTQPVYVRFRP